TLAPSPEPSATLAPSPEPSATLAPSPEPSATLAPFFAAPTSSLPAVASPSELTYEVMFQYIGAEYDIDWRLLASMAYKESSLNPSAIGRDGEIGLMQILPSTWDEFAPKAGVSDPFDPVSNVQVGATYLAYVRDQLIWRGYPEEYWALVAYNWGPNNLGRLLKDEGNWGGIPILRQNYAYDIIDQIASPTANWWHLLKEPVY
ncbi:MAG: transglycosylase SLT domain-containing protein, partial [Ardenticatenaceae bacterium]